MGRVPPFLSLDDRIQYIEDKNYLPCKIKFKDHLGMIMLYSHIMLACASLYIQTIGGYLDEYSSKYLDYSTDLEYSCIERLIWL